MAPLVQVQMADESNNYCADCSAAAPDWVATPYGAVGMMCDV